MENMAVRHINKNGKRIILIGTAHTSQQSARLIKSTIKREMPNVVCVELCESRYDLKTNKYRTINPPGAIPRMLKAVAVSAYGGERAGVDFGSAVQAARNVGAEIELIDMDIHATIRNFAKAMSVVDIIILVVAYVLSGLNTSTATDISEIEKLINQACEDDKSVSLGRKHLDKVLVEDRNKHMAERISRVEACKILVVVGAGHLNGIEKLLLQGI